MRRLALVHFYRLCRLNRPQSLSGAKVSAINPEGISRMFTQTWRNPINRPMAEKPGSRSVKKGAVFLINP